ncbi:MAG: LegC family aminotransferase [Candidatus Nanopelagicales bacterium]|nr:LegC family aminotransferase [Candidatus Nanopelagicales bacterium]
MNALPATIVAALASVLGDGPVPLHEPHFDGNESRYLFDCVASTYVSSVGAYVDRLEADLAEFTGAKHAVATINGTSALHIALLLAGVQPGDEVLVPALSFVATANAVRYCGATPHFLDSQESTLGLDPAAMRSWLAEISTMKSGECVNQATGRRITAMVPMHAFGHPCDVVGVMEVAAEYGLPVVEDAAESLGSLINGQHTGTFGLLGTLSFNGNKIATTGGGGAILTNDTQLAKRAKHLTTTAKVPHRWEYNHDEVGYNYRMPNINAALGCAQLEQIDSFIASKRRLYDIYLEALRQVNGVTLFSEPRGSRSNYWLQTLILDKDKVDQRDEVLETLNDNGLMARPAWTLLSSLKPFLGCPSAPLTGARLLEQRIINVPSSAGLA